MSLHNYKLLVLVLMQDRRRYIVRKFLCCRLGRAGASQGFF